MQSLRAWHACSRTRTIVICAYAVKSELLDMYVAHTPGVKIEGWRGD